MNQIEFLDEYPISTPCSCGRCKEMCKRPCWPLPGEAKRLIEAGYADRLMLDYWCKPEGNIYLLCPATPGHEHGEADFWDIHAGCIFHDENGLCQLHDQGLKPFEGKVANCFSHYPKLHEDVAMQWDTPLAQSIVKQWMDLTGSEDDCE